MRWEGNCGREIGSWLIKLCGSIDDESDDRPNQKITVDDMN